MRSAWVVVMAVLLRPSSAGAGEGTKAPFVTSADKDADAYCRWTVAAARSESDLFLLPQLFATAGEVSGAEASAQTAAGTQPTTPTTTTLGPTPRVIAGGIYSFGATGLYHGLALRAQADAECRRYTTTAKLRAFIERNKDGLSVEGLRSKGKVLDEALPRAAEIVAGQKRRLTQQRDTVEEVDATLLRADALRKLAADTHTQIESMAAVPPLPKEPIRDVLRERDEAESAAEAGALHVRQSRAWDLAVRGGYDRIFGVSNYTPVFVEATLTLSLGWFLQPGNDADAKAARREFARAEVLGVDDRIEQVIHLLAGTRAAEEQRLRDNRILLADLEGRFKEVSALEGERARAYAESVWFDLIRTRADNAYYEAHVRELSVLLGAGGS